MLDTGDFYSMGKNELPVGKAIQSVAGTRLLLSVKFGAAARTGRSAPRAKDARPAATKNFLAHSLSRLGVDFTSTIYRPARVDPNVPDRSIRSARSPTWFRPSYVRCIGLSEVGADTIRRAAEVISDLATCKSNVTALVSRSAGRSIIPALRELSIGMIGVPECFRAGC